MKSQIVFKKVVILAFLSVVTITVHAQGGATTSNPLEYAAIGEGEANIAAGIAQQINSDAGVTVEGGGQLIMNTKIKNWEKKYNAYLKGVQFGNKIAAACSIYAEGIRILQSLWELQLACRVNPQGIGTAVPMTDLYIRTGCQFIQTYRTLQSIVKQDGTNSGNENMSNGAERVRMLWQLTGELEELNSNLHCLSRAILVTTFKDVWNDAISGMIEKDHRTLAKEANDRAMTAMKNVAAFYKLQQKGQSPWGHGLLWN